MTLPEDSIPLSKAPQVSPAKPITDAELDDLREYAESSRGLLFGIPLRDIVARIDVEMKGRKAAMSLFTRRGEMIANLTDELTTSEKEVSALIAENATRNLNRWGDTE